MESGMPGLTSPPPEPKKNLASLLRRLKHFWFGCPQDMIYYPPAPAAYWICRCGASKHHADYYA